MAFSWSGDLRRHVRIHTGEKNHKCGICDATFSQSTNLKVHMRKHTGERRYRCLECGAAFFQSGHLQRHMQSHVDEMNYRCQFNADESNGRSESNTFSNNTVCGIQSSDPAFEKLCEENVEVERLMRTDANEDAAHCGIADATNCILTANKEEETEEYVNDKIGEFSLSSSCCRSVVVSEADTTDSFIVI